MIRKILATAIREYRTTALTRAFFLGAVVLPLVIWGLMIGVGSFNFQEQPLEGTLAVVDRSEGAHIGDALVKTFNPEAQTARAAEIREEALRLVKSSPLAELTDEKTLDTALNISGIGVPAVLEVKVLPPDADVEALRPKVVAGEYLGLLIVDEGTILAESKPASAPTETADASNTTASVGKFEFIQPTELRPSHADTIRDAVRKAVREERFRRASINPVTVDTIQRWPVESQTVVMTKDGKEKSANEGATRILPIIFFFLVYMGSMYGGSYLFYGTLEEKSSRVVEVLLSAVSVKELLLGKFLGQGLVGLTVLVIYGGLGLAVASKFPSVFDQIPLHLLPWVIVYFLIAYGMFGALMLAVGSAVSEIREAQALFTPITMLIVVVYVSIFPVMQNPGSVISRVLSYFPPTTPFVMVMRLSQPSHYVSPWELAGSTLAGIIGVVIAFWAAAKVFRVGILMYGKPPNLMTLWKWIRYA